MLALSHALARAAILAAADHIEKNPRQYRDAAAFIPDSLSARGSCLGWIGYFAGYQRDDGCASGVVLNVLRCAMPQAFHHRMCDIDAGWRSWIWSWRSSARRAAWCLRRYADRHHPATREVSERSPCAIVIPGLTDWENY